MRGGGCPVHTGKQTAAWGRLCERGIYMQKKLEPGELLDEQGNLAQAGYAMSLVKKYDREKIQANPLRIKEWDYYLIYNPHFGVALTVDDNSYMGLMSISFLDFDNRTERTVSPMTVFPWERQICRRTPGMERQDTGIGNVIFSFQAEEGRTGTQGLDARFRGTGTDPDEDHTG